MIIRTKFGLLAAAACALPLAAPAAAQSAGATDARDGVAEDGGIIVTATRRNVEVQDVPLAIQAIGGADLEQQGAVNFADYGRTLAGVQFQDDGPGRSQIFIRGVSSGADVDTGKESTVGVYFDEIPVSEGSSQPDLKLYDVNRVEVLRGPQGTLYGSGSLGGTVRVITNQPDFDGVAGYAHVVGSVTEHGGENGAIDGWLNVPLSENTAVRAVGYALHNSGFLDNGLTGEKDINDEETYGGRLALRHAPSEMVDIVLTGAYQHTEVGAYNRMTDNYPGLVLDQAEPEPFTDKFGMVNLKVTADLGFGELTSSTSYFDRSRNFENDIDYFVGTNVRSILDYSAESFTQEVRLASTAEGPFGWLFGGYYVDRDESFGQTVNFAGVPVPDADGDNLFFSAKNSGVEQIAGFGELGFELLEGLTFTTGLRVSHTKRGEEVINDGLLLGGFRDEQTGKASSTSYTPKFNLSYKVNEDTLLFAQAAKGFRIGGANPGLPPCATCVVTIDTEFGSDSLWNYEVGVKSQPISRVLTLNASLFWIDWKNIQLNVSREDGFNGIANAGTARSRGAEVEFNLRASPDFEWGGQVTYTDAELRSLAPGLVDFAVLGKQLPQVPHWSLASYAEYGVDVGTDGRVTLRGDVQYQGARNNALTLSPLRLEDYVLAKLRLSYARDAWEVALFVDNLFDKRAQLDRNILPDARTGFATSLDRYTVNTPRTFGVSLSANF